MDPIECTVDASRDGLRELCLSDAGDVFDQDMTLSDEGEDHQFDHLSFSLNDRLDIAYNLVEPIDEEFDLLWACLDQRKLRNLANFVEL